jgi:threonine aldolase
MANQTALKLHTQPGEQIIADKYAHVYLYGGGASFNSGVSFVCLMENWNDNS